VNSANEYVLEMTDISKSYGHVKALSDVRFQLRSGEVMALLGENGAGKSTLVKILSGLVTPDAGSIRFKGEEIAIKSPHDARAAGIAVVQQELSLVPTLTVAENLFIGAKDVKGAWTSRKLAAMGRPLLERVGLGDMDPRRLTETLSVGEMQLVEIARLLGRNAGIFILDEPTAALSDIEIERVMGVVRRLTEQGSTVIYVTHRLGEVFEIADRATVFRNGRSLDPVAVADLTVATLVERMLGRDLGEMYPSRAASLGPVRVEITDLETPGLVAPVTVTARQGEIVGLAGQLGSGAPAVLRSVMGIGFTSGGSVKVDGVEVTRASRQRMIASGVGYCSDDRKKDGIFALQSVIQNFSSAALGSVSRLGWLLGGRERALARRVSAAFAFDEKRVSARAGNLSGGNQQKVALGKWLAIAPKVLLVEEPTRGVDVGARAEIYRNLRDLADQGLTILFVSSDLAEVHGLSDTVVTFYRGRMIASRAAVEYPEQQMMLDVTHDPSKSSSAGPARGSVA
jgi:ABC-type sugar transport system ATPase subunit